MMRGKDVPVSSAYICNMHNTSAISFDYYVSYRISGEGRYCHFSAGTATTNTTLLNPGDNDSSSMTDGTA